MKKTKSFDSIGILTKLGILCSLMFFPMLVVSGMRVSLFTVLNFSEMVRVFGHTDFLAGIISSAVISVTNIIAKAVVVYLLLVLASIICSLFKWNVAAVILSALSSASIIFFEIILLVAARAATYSTYILDSDVGFKVGIGLTMACLLNVFSCFTLLFKSWNNKIENAVFTNQQMPMTQSPVMVPPVTAQMPGKKPTVCNACGYDTTINPLYCGNCGNTVNQPLPNSQVCKNCGAIVPAAHKYCHNCRTILR